MKLSRRGLLAASALLPVPFAGRAAYGDDDDDMGDRKSWPDALVMGTGRPGGEYALYGPEWGSLVQQASGVAVSYRASGGAASDILLIEQNAAQLGMTTVTIADQARAGLGNWTAGVKFQSFRALFPMFPSILQVVASRASGITTLAGLAGQTIGTGPDGGSGSVAVPAILGGLGVIPGRISTGDYGAQVGDMMAGRLAACVFIGAPPIPAIVAGAQRHRLALIGFTQAEIAHTVRTATGLMGMVLPAGIFPGQTMPVASIGTANFAIASAALPDSLVRVLTLAALRNRAALAALVPAAMALPGPGLIAGGTMPFHPGAVAALHSLGLAVPGDKPGQYFVRSTR